MPIDAPVGEVAMEVNAAASDAEMSIGLQVLRIKDVSHFFVLDVADSDFSILGGLDTVFGRGDAFALVDILWLKVKAHQVIKRISSNLHQLGNGVGTK